MPATIDYYFTCASPWVYLGHDAIGAIAKKHGAQLSIKAVALGKLFENSGQVALAKRPSIRQRYRMLELQRYADLLGRTMNFKPRSFPVDPTLADLTVTAILADGMDAWAYMASIFAALWENEQDIADESTLARLLDAGGFDAGAVLRRAREDEIAAIRLRNTEEALAADVIGVPSYVLNGEPFWGQDRIDLLDRALSTGRKPFKPL